LGGKDILVNPQPQHLDYIPYEDNMLIGLGDVSRYIIGGEGEGKKAVGFDSA
jgi:hypothetical protein